jgi:tetrahydromethanopterin S-methyltransferase subunit G
MSTNANKLPKATVEIVNEYNELQQKMKGIDPSMSDQEVNAISARLNELQQQYDWFNVEFTDPVTGKKGLKTVAGELIAPAQYDGFNELQSYLYSPHAPVIAIKEGKCGIVRGDGSGQQLCDFKFDDIRTYTFTTLFLARWDGVKDRFGIIAANGEIICPNILTAYGDQPCNGIAEIFSDDKCGVIDLDTYQCVLPEYDELEIDAEADIVFVKGDKRGYVTEENGEFVTIEQYETDENYIDVPVFATRLP